MSNVLVTQGSQTSIRTITIGTNDYPVVILNLGTSADSGFTGTLPGLTNLAGGTISAVNIGTLNVGTINAGTVDTISKFPPNPWGTTITSGTSTLGTIKPLVAGSAIFITDLIISAGSATTLVIGAGGTTTPFMGTLSFAAQGGLVSNFRVPGSITSGSALVYQQSANGPLSITAIGFVR